MSKSGHKKVATEEKIQPVTAQEESAEVGEKTQETSPENNGATAIEEKIEKIYILVSAIAQAVISSGEKEPDEEEIIQRIMSSDEIKARIISDYLKNLGSKNAVSVMSGQVGATPLTPVNKPKSLADAKKLAELLIKR